MEFKPNTDFKYYLEFIAERMNIFWSKHNGEPQPWTDNEILATHKFTNVYRVLDRSSQYLLSNVINNGKQYTEVDMAWRIILYKLFNKPETWDALVEEFGDVDLCISLDRMLAFFKGYQDKNVVFTNAYMITAAAMQSKVARQKYGLEDGMRKTEIYLRPFYGAFIDEELIIDVLTSSTMEQAFTHLKKVPGIADFLAYQLVQDLNYTDLVHWGDNEFCSAGTGTIRGITRTFDIVGKPNYLEIVKWVQNNFEILLKQYNVDFKPLPNHMPTVADLSNCFCETDKYMRGLGISSGVNGKKIKQRYSAPKPAIQYTFPHKWNVDFV